MPKSMQLNLPPVQLQKVTGEFATEAKPSVTARQSVTWEAIPETAFDRACLQRKNVAADLGKSNSWFCRALKGIEKLGWNDLGVISDKTFWVEVVDMIVAFHDLPVRGASPQDIEDMRIGRAFRELQQMTQRSTAR